MATVEVVVGTPLSEALQTAIQPKLIEAGWSTDNDDSALAEYVVLMLVNGKSQQQIASELSTDLLGLGPEDEGTAQFALWLFETVASLNAQLNGNAPVSRSALESKVEESQEQSAEAAHESGINGSAGDVQGSIPTGPKMMRNGHGTQRTRDKRMLGQINKSLGTPDAALHRVRSANGVGRINSHSSREPPKGPRAQQLQRGPQAPNAPIGRPMGAAGLPMGMNPGAMLFQPQQQMMGMGMGMGMGFGMGMDTAQPGGLTPQQQLQLLQMMEQQSLLLANMMATHNGSGNPMFGMQTVGDAPGKSMFERVEERPNRRNNRPPFNNRQRDQPTADKEATPSTTEVETSSDKPIDPGNTICRFNLECQKPDCAYAHQSSAAPPGVTVDLNDACMYGAACRNFKCVAKHPSPAKKFAHQAETQCRFGVTCTKPICPFKHPTPCRNGADCQVENCNFAHNPVMCKFTPCKNPVCVYKHADGQKGVFGDKVWTADGVDDAGHVSDRKFVTEGGDEELIIPGSGSNDVDAEAQEAPELDADVAA